MSKADQLLTALLASDSTFDELRQALQPFNWPVAIEATQENIRILCIQAALTILLRPNTRFRDLKQRSIDKLRKQLEEARRRSIILEHRFSALREMLDVHSAALGMAKEEVSHSINDEDDGERPTRVMPKTDKEIERATKKRSQQLLNFISAPKHRVWAELFARAPSKEYNEKLTGETDALPPGARHAILWSLQPATLQLEDYIEELMSFLSDKQQDIVIKLREALQKDITYPTATHRLFGPAWSNFKAIAEECNGEVVDVDLLAVIRHLSKGISWFQGDAHTSMSELDFERKVYSVIDVAFENLPQQSNKKEKERNQRPDLMVFTREGNAPLIIVEDEQKLHSAVSHEDTYKLFEQCQRALENNAKRGVYRQIMGQLNGGKRSTIFIASCIKINGEIHYELRWLKNAQLSHTFDYSYEFVPQIFMLYLCFNLAEATFNSVGIKKALFERTGTIRAKGNNSDLCTYYQTEYSII